jgi:Tol biopolymer transport system component
MRRAAAAVSLAIACAVGLGVSGCAGRRISREEIPEQPIAFVYFDAETTRRRSEWLAEAMEGDRPRAPDPRGAAIAPVNEIAEFIQKQFGAGDRKAKRFQGRLALLDPRTGDVRVVEGARKGAVPQDWSSDHERLLFAQIVQGEIPHLYELHVATGEVGPVTHGRMAHPEGCYGPDGSIVFTSVDPSARERSSRIMITDAGGGEPQQLSPPGFAYYPTCAPDGSAVAYTSVGSRGRVQRVVVHSPVRTGEPRIVAAGKEPSFSDDGRWISYSGLLKKEWRTWRIRPDGTGRTSLGHGGYDERRPSLSPDNRLVVYVADTVFHQQLYLRRVDGTGDRILVADGDGDRPIW